MSNINPHKRGTIGYEAYAKAGYTTPKSRTASKVDEFLTKLFVSLAVLVLVVFGGAQLINSGWVVLDTSHNSGLSNDPVIIASAVIERYPGLTLEYPVKKCAGVAIIKIQVSGENVFGANLHKNALIVGAGGVNHLVLEDSPDYATFTSKCTTVE